MNSKGLYLKLSALWFIGTTTLFGPALSQGQVYEKVFSFTDARHSDFSESQNRGRRPNVGITLGVDGNYYGTTHRGGLKDVGTLFRLASDGTLTTLVEFTSNGASNKGSFPESELIQANDGNFYGTTLYGGTHGHGTVFRVSPSGILTTLVEFTNNGASNKGSEPSSSLLEGSDGFLYGTTASGGSNGNGTVFKMSKSGNLTTLAEFTNNGAMNKGSHPVAGLVQGPDGNLYGTTERGGAHMNSMGYSFGTIFRVTPNGSLTTLVEFTGSSAIGDPRSFENNMPISIRDNSTAEPYPSTIFVPPGINKIGQVRVSLKGISHSWPSDTRVLLVSPTGTTCLLMAQAGGGTPVSNVTITLSDEGISGIPTPIVPGTFKPTPKGDQLSAMIPPSPPPPYGTTLAAFKGEDATGEWSLFVLDDSLGDSGSLMGGWTLEISPSLPPNGAVGRNPFGGMIFGDDGYLYGTTRYGGISDKGTIFKMSVSGELTTIAEFSGNGFNQSGAEPMSELVPDFHGNFYGTTRVGGSKNFGTVFKLETNGQVSTLVEFSQYGNSNKGSHPSAPLVFGNDGSLYGTTEHGGIDDGDLGYGTAFKVTPGGILTTLLEFTGIGTDFGTGPVAQLAQDTHGNFYGTTFGGGADDTGTVFMMSSDGKVNTLAEFFVDGSRNKGALPWGGLIQGQDSAFYGTAQFGASFGSGTIFRIDQSGKLTTLVEFTGNGAINKGSYPRGELCLGSDGTFYGTTNWGGNANFGTVFQVTESGELTTLVQFTGNGPDNKGSRPDSGVVQDGLGEFFGMTSEGGSFNLGTVFKMTSTGDLTTLVEFTGNGLVNKGAFPVGKLLVGTDGSFYGTTKFGGSGNFGTVFRMTRLGELTTLVEFTGNGELNKGSNPYCGLTEGIDGAFYGTTFGGGESDNGTVFRITPEGLLTTIFDFSDDPTDPGPYSGLLQGHDGNLYGTTSGDIGGDGSIFRLVFPGRPTVVQLAPVIVTGETAVIKALVNGRGTSTTTHLEYGVDGISFPESVQISSISGDYRTRNVGITILNLASGTNYYYRIRASSSLGVTTTSVLSFSTLAPPNVFLNISSGVSSTSAHLNAIVNPRNFEATVMFEYGTDGNSFPHSVPASPYLVTGNTPVPVSAPVAGLTKGTTYFYRVVATNAGGTAVSGTQSFRTLTEPVPQVGGSFALSTTSARVEGLVDPEGSDTTVVFEYGTDGENFPNSVSAPQGLQSGIGNRPVSAVFSNLAQGTTYHYRLRATSDGGVGVSGTATFSMNVLSGFEQVTPGAPPESGGFLTVNLSPPGLLHGWRFVGEPDWRDPRIQARGLVTGGRYEIEFRPVPGYITPFPMRDDHAVEIDSGGAPTVVEAMYYATEAAGTGGISVTLKPDSITTGEGRAQWRLLGEGEEDWRDSASTVSGLVAGNYLVELKPVTNRTTPAHVSVLVVEGQTTAPTVTYFSSGDTTGIAPVPLAFETIAATENNPFAFVGQIRSRSGLGTGFVVKPRVVATAAHVVWDEGTLSGAEGLQWIHRQHRGVHEPPSHVPRGFFILTGYDEARTLESSPGSFSPQSRNRDIAALYFTDRDAAQGGYGGFLASDLEENEFLLSDANKRFAAYPVDGITPLSRGLMHATTPFNIGFSPVSFTPLATGEPPLPEGRRLFFTTDIRSSGGASGGPLFVQFEGGAYYPAAVYLGGTSQMIVRAIDSASVELFNRAAESSIEDNGNTGGGITHSSVTTIGGADTAGALKVNLAPAGAVAAGARWRLGPDAPWRSSGEQAGGLSNGRYILELSSVPGYQLPAPQNVQVKGGQLKTLAFSYALLPVPAAAITLRGSERSIGNGDASPSALDSSDFGLVAVDGGTATRSFTLSNPGTAELSLGSIALGGSHSDDFSLSIPPGSSVPPGGSTTFTILFDPSASGTRSATVSFATNVTGSNPFTFAIQGNDTTDSDSDGFTDVEEAALADLLASFTVGQTIDLDIAFLRLGSGQILALLNLPPGLSFDPGTNRITGTITGKAATPQVEIRKLAGADIVSSITTDFPVFTPARLTVSGARPFPATRIGRRSKPQTLVVTNSGELALNGVSVRTTGKAARDFVLTQPRTKTLDAGGSTNFTVTFKPRAKGSRRASVTIFSNTAPVSLPVSGKGK